MYIFLILFIFSHFATIEHPGTEERKAAAVCQNVQKNLLAIISAKYSEKCRYQKIFTRVQAAKYILMSDTK